MEISFNRLWSMSECLEMARSGSTPSVRNGAENGQRFMDRHKKRPPDRAAFRFDQFRELSLRLQQNLVSRFIG
jgi:hypothetical protein